MVLTHQNTVSTGQVITYRAPHLRQQWTAELGMIIFLVSWAMLFAALFFVYGGIRTKAAIWPPVDQPPLPLAWPFANSVALGLSSYALHRGLAAIQRGRPRGLTLGLGFATALGLLFLAGQWGVWWQLYAAGFTHQSGTYGSSFFGLTGLHAVHVLVGLVALGWMTVRAGLGHYTAARFFPIRLWAMYWHFVGVIWGLMFLTMYIL